MYPLSQPQNCAIPFTSLIHSFLHRLIFTLPACPRTGPSRRVKCLSRHLAPSLQHRPHQSLRISLKSHPFTHWFTSVSPLPPSILSPLSFTSPEPSNAALSVASSITCPFLHCSSRHLPFASSLPSIRKLSLSISLATKFRLQIC